MILLDAPTEAEEALILAEFENMGDPIEYIIDRICPDLVQDESLRDVRIGLMCTMVNIFDIKRQRDRLHILLHGQHGTGKTVILDWLNTFHNSCYISCDPTAASLKGNAGMADGGVKILSEYDLGVVCIDDIELMKDTDTLRDVMEKGMYTLTKGGRHEEYLSRCRIVGACNTLNKLSEPLLSRFDLVYKFDVPTVENAVAIAERIFMGSPDQYDSEFIEIYFKVVKEFDPQVNITPERIREIFTSHFNNVGGGKAGRWIASVKRIARALAKLRMCDITEAELQLAIRLKNKSDTVISTCRQ